MACSMYVHMYVCTCVGGEEGVLLYSILCTGYVGPCIRAYILYFCSEVPICTCMCVGGMCCSELGFGCVLVGGGDVLQ